jgi:hypothetical protein
VPPSSELDCIRGCLSKLRAMNECGLDHERTFAQILLKIRLYCLSKVLRYSSVFCLI